MKCKPKLQLQKKHKPSNASLKKALSAIQSTCPEVLPSTYSANHAKDHSFVILGVGRDKNLHEVKAAIKKAHLFIGLTHHRCDKSRQASPHLLLFQDVMW